VIACTRCKRRLLRDPVMLEGRAFGPTCAALVGGDLLAEKPKRAQAMQRTPRRRRDERQLDLLEVRP
jgi:hypothetical protein